MTVHSVLIQKLLSTSAHLGRRVTTHHFKPYTFGTRNAVSVIDSDKTLISLRNAVSFLSSLARLDANFLFVNTNPLSDEIVSQMSQTLNLKHNTSWKLSGFLTNAKSPKKFRSRNKKMHLSAVRPADCVVVMDTERKSSVVLEADKLGIPIVGLVDSSMPWEIYRRITYPIPCNDSVKFVYLFCNLVTKTFLAEKKRVADGVREEDIAAVTQLDGTGEESQSVVQLASGTSDGKLRLISYESLALPLDDASETKKLLDKIVVLKLNHSVGNKMGFSGPKSSIEVYDGRTYLDLIVNQIESLNSKHGCTVPLILLNTLKTHDDALKVVEKYSEKNFDILTLCQSPSHPVKRGQSSEDEMYHFDHRELFLSLKNSGTLDALLVQGKEFIFVANSDNLGATIDTKILNHLTQNGIEYCMEVMPNKEYSLGSLQGKFQSAEELRHSDTGSLWVNLKAVKRYIESGSPGVEKYPITKFFEQPIGVNVPQSCFQTIMETSDFLLLQSDLYTHTEGVLTRNSARTSLVNPSIELGPEFEQLIDLRSRFKSAPSIIELDSLKVKGDVWFGAGITLKGKVTIAARPGVKLEIPDGTVLENKEITDPSDI